MKAGQLKEVINIMQPTELISDYGEVRTTYTLRYTTRATVTQTSQSRAERESEIMYPTNFTFYVRLYVPVYEKDLVEWNGNKYRITAIFPFKAAQEKIIYGELIND